MDLQRNRIGAVLVERRIAITKRCDQPLRGERIENHVRRAHHSMISPIASVATHARSIQPTRITRVSFDRCPPYPVTT